MTTKGIEQDAYGRLTPVARVLAQLYAVLSPTTIPPEQTRRILADAGVRIGGRRINSKDIRQRNDELVDARIANRDVTGTALRLVSEWVIPVLRAAHRDGNLPRLLRMAENGHPFYGHRGAFAGNLIRIRLVQGDTAALRELTGRYSFPEGHWRYLAEPWADDLLDALPEPVQTQALRDCLYRVLESAAPPGPAIAAAGANRTRQLALIPDAAFIRILQGRFDEADNLFSGLPEDLRAEKSIAIARAGTRALIGALRGDDEEARRQIDKALELERAGTRKRLIFPDCRAFALALIALARIDTAASHDLILLLERGAERTGVEWYAERDFVVAASRVKTGHRLHLGTPHREPCIDLFLQTLACCWLEEFPKDWPAWRGEFLEFRERAIRNGYDWIVAECNEILRRAPVGKRRSEFDSSGATHAALGTTTLATLAAPLPAWEFSLKALEKIAFEIGSQAKRKKSPSASTARLRLAWILDDQGYEIGARPREQRQLKNGSWTKGRKMSMQRLVNDAAKLEYLLPQDRNAATAVERERNWEGKHTIWAGLRALHALAGHPHVYNEAGRPVDIVRREPELSIGQSRNGQLVVTVEPRDHDYIDQHPRYIASMATGERCEVTHFTASHLRLMQFIPPDGLSLPTEARPRLLEAVSAVAAEMRVHSAESESTGAAEPVDSDPEPWVRLEPFEAGLSVTVMVEPIPESGISYEPGGGGITVFANRSGQSVQTSRDLAREKAALQRLIGQCPALVSQPTEAEPLLLPDPEPCLELLESLEDAGARCQWPKGQPFRIVARAATPSLSLSVQSADQWLQATGNLAVDKDRVLGLKRLFDLLEENSGSRFVQLEEGQFVALEQTFRRHLDDLASISTPRGKNSVRLHALAAPALDDLLAGADLTTDDEYDRLRSRVASAKAVEPEVPSTLRAELRPYQVEGFRWLARLAHWGAGACLADDMGLGKTVQALALLLRRAPEGPSLVVAPTSVAANWLSEAHRFAPTLNLKPYAGPNESRAPLLDAPGAFDLYVTTYGLLQNDIERLARVSWHSVVLDEAQAIKNPATKRARAARRLVADFRLVTTGTPIQNHLMDLHSLFSFLNPGLLGSAQRFRSHLGGAAERGDREANVRLRRLIAPFLLRRLKTEVLDDLPERTEITLHVRMSPEEAAVYEALRERAVEELDAARGEGDDLDGGSQRVQVLAHLTRLRLACCHPRLALGGTGLSFPEDMQSAKLRTFAETVAELIENQHKVLVFSQFVKHLKLVEQYVAGAGIAYQYLDGATPSRARQERIRAFQSGQGDIFLISLKAGGTGLNLTAADYVIHLDPWWNPAVEDQASDRAHRIGQRRPVTIYRLVAEGTIEEQIVELHRRKRDLAEQLLEGTDATARLSAGELLALLRKPLEGSA